jgi:hypothetical protein
VQQLRLLTGWVHAINPIFIRRHRTAATFSDAELYDMRIKNRLFIPALMAGLQIPARWECENGTVENREVGFMMFLWWISFPRKISCAQEKFGREYSQISRIMKRIWDFMNTRWAHLVTNNLNYFVPRLPYYNQCLLRKGQALNFGGLMPARWSHTALLTDGHKIRINDDEQVHFSGHIHAHCLSFLITSAMDGMIVEGYGARTGSENDHGLQNLSQIGHRLLAAQAGMPQLYTSGTDKGFHAQVAIVPMHNNLINTAAQTLENEYFSSCRATNEWDVGRPSILWKYIDFNKVQFHNLQPLGLFFRVCCIMSNALTILEGNQTSEFYNCEPPRNLADYFV